MDVLNPTESHVDHAVKWIVPNHNSSTHMCMACMLELLEDPEMPAVKKKYVLSEYLSFVNSSMESIVHVLQQEQEVASHVCSVLYDLTSSPDELFVSMAVEGLVLLVCNLKLEDLVCNLVDSVIEQSMTDCNYNKSLPGFYIVQRLLSNIEGLAIYLLDNKGLFIDYLCSGLRYPRENVQDSILNILIFLCSHGELPPHVHRMLAGEVIHLLNTTVAVETSMNTLGLLKKMIPNKELLTSLMATTEDGATLPSSLKKALVSRQVVIQIAATQCVSEIIAKNPACVETLLAADIAEFLYEGLSSSNELLLRSIFCCLTLFTDSDTFFSKCHTVYGIDSILRAIDQAFKERNPQTLCHGISLLSILLDKHPTCEINLLNSTFKVKTCMRLISEGIHHSHHQVANASCKALINFIQEGHLGACSPSEDIKKAVHFVAEKIKREKLARNGSRLLGRKSNKHNNGRIERCLLNAQNLLKILEKICRVFFNRDGRCMINEQSFLVPHGERNDTSTDEMYGFVLQEMDEICVPFFLCNFHEISTEEFFINFYKVLCLMGERNAIGLKSLYAKLAESGFIAITLQIRSKFRNQCLTMSSGEFLSCLVSELSSDYENSGVKPILVSGLGQYEGTLQETVKILCQQALDGDPAFSDNQHTCVLLLYASFLFGNRPVELPLLVESVCSFLSQHATLPQLLIKPLVFLTAIGLNEVNTPWPRGVKCAIQVLLHSVNTCTQASQWFTHHPAVLHWVFTHPHIQQSCGHTVLQMWMDNWSSQNEDTPDPQLELLVADNELCYNTLLEIMIGGDEKSSQNATSLVKSVLKNYGIGSFNGNQCEPMQQSFIRILLKLFLDQSVGISRCNITSLLDVMCLVLQQSTTVDTSFYVKIIYHVLNFMVNKTLNGPAVTNFLICLLSWELNSNVCSISSLLLGNCELLELLEDWMKSNDTSKQACSNRLLEQLTQLQVKHNMQAQKDVLVCGESLLMMFKSKDQTLVLSCIRLLTIVFKTRLCPCFLKVAFNNMPVVRDTQSSCILTLETARLLLIYLQQQIVQGDTVTQQSSVDCLIALHEYLTQDNPPVALHILNQPWNRFLLTACVQFHSDNWPRWLWQILELFLSNQDATVLTSEDLHNLVNLILETTDTKYSYCKSQVIKQILRHERSPSQTEELTAKLSFFEASETLETRYCLLEVDGRMFCVKEEN